MAIRPANQPGDLGWIVQQHGEVYARDLGWSTEFEALVAGIVGEFAAHADPKQAAWIAELDGERVGCVMCTRENDQTAKLRVLLVLPEARGHGVGHQLVETCIGFARAAGYERMTLWTVAGLDSARKIYKANGFDLAAEEPAHLFGHDVIGQTWTLTLLDRP